MLFQHRKEVIDKLTRLEMVHPVDTWRVAGVDFWPVLKNQIFFSEFKAMDSSKKTHPRVSLSSRILLRVSKLINAYRYLFSLNLEKAPILFSGSHSHRVNWQGKLYNRYFDTMADFLNSGNKLSYIVEYQSIKKDSVYNNERLIEGSVLVSAFSGKSNVKRELTELLNRSDYQIFEKQLNLYFPDFTKSYLRVLINSITNIIRWKNMYKYIFRKIQPSYAVGLCYYSNAMYGMNLAANELGIISVDMQHGTQGPLHPSYHFSKIAEDSYNVLPREFWCWDTGSSNHLKGWIGKNEKVRVTGNPWITFLRDQNKDAEFDIPSDKPIILYTHQPLKPSINSYIIEAIIKTKEIYHWWIRLHPRISDNERAELFTALRENGIEDVVDIERASEIPLPILFSHSAVHISKYSGAVIEGVEAGIPTLILEEIGCESFENIISGGSAVGLMNPDTESVLNELCSLIANPRFSVDPVDYKKELINCKL